MKGGPFYYWFSIFIAFISKRFGPNMEGRKYPVSIKSKGAVFIYLSIYPSIYIIHIWILHSFSNYAEHTAMVGPTLGVGACYEMRLPSRNLMAPCYSEFGDLDLAATYI